MENELLNDVLSEIREMKKDTEAIKQKIGLPHSNYAPLAFRLWSPMGTETIEEAIFKKLDGISEGLKKHTTNESGEIRDILSSPLSKFEGILLTVFGSSFSVILIGIDHLYKNNDWWYIIVGSCILFISIYVWWFFSRKSK